MDSDELKATIEPAPMLQCLRALLAAHTASSPALGNFVSAYAQVSHAASPWLSDSGATSTYANNSKASFYRALIETNPYLLDTMLLADPDEFARLRAVLAWLSDARDKYGHEGAFAQLIVPIDRAPLAHYLSEEAAEADRQALAFLLRSVWKASNARKHFSQSMPILQLLCILLIFC